MKAKKNTTEPVIKLINTHQAKSQLSRLMREVEEKGVLIRICRDGKPIVELRRVSRAPDPLQRRPEISKIKFFEDPAAPIDEADWPESLR